jgi:hypothetical protein
MNLVAEDYTLEFSAASHTACFKGAMRLSSMRAYDVVKDFLHRAAAQVPNGALLTLDVTGLQFLNSSGITTLSMFVIAIRDSKKCQLTIKGSRSVAWQYKSLGNFKRLWKEVDLVIS